MYEETSLGVVIPAYNEAGFIGDVIDSVPNYVSAVVVIDDHSTDGTWEEIHEHIGDTRSRVTGETARKSRSDGGTRTMAAAEPPSEFDRRTVTVRHTTNRGRGAAIKTGYRIAQTMELDVVAVIDGDGQMDPAILDRIVDPVVNDEADYAKGDRLVSPRHCREMSRWRLFGNTLLTWLTRVASGKWGVRDPQNGYTAISAEALDAIAIEELYEDYGFLNDLLIRLDANNMEVADVAMQAVYSDETSGIRYRHFAPNLSLLLLRGFVWRLWYKYVASGQSDRPPHSQPS
ncbi:glycosyltransferase family 2 protein [Haloarcula sp. S1CR25-12]|uniref:Glycosyltransferase family 2 protein n=1 Tax=Haloarcula saliterrae TaxID=2950534 RepID=A0ABU2F962_9EURY|nr:glycosyltransferase family 2 protein [Haloarcula sp. S1CR25-12]MDS0258346.1 glycosyltransferase family 2 protein [Haloarcula sp. S1CR25-12]